MVISALLGAFLLAGCTQQQDDGTPEINLSTDDEVVPEPESSTVDIILDEWGITPSNVAVDAGTVEFEVSNEGSLYHELQIVGNGVDVELEGGVDSGETKTLKVELPAGTYEVICPIPGSPSHRDRGMEATLVVE